MLQFTENEPTNNKFIEEQVIFTDRMSNLRDIYIPLDNNHLFKNKNQLIWFYTVKV